MQNYENLDLKKTVETTFERAKGWLRAKYPSAVNSKSNFEIDVRYPGESIPTTGENILIETAWTPMSSKINFDKAPSLILFRRGNNEVFMKKIFIKQMPALKKNPIFWVSIRVRGQIIVWLKHRTERLEGSEIPIYYLPFIKIRTSGNIFLLS